MLAILRSHIDFKNSDILNKNINRINPNCESFMLFLDTQNIMYSHGRVHSKTMRVILESAEVHYQKLTSRIKLLLRWHASRIFVISSSLDFPWNT